MLDALKRLQIELEAKRLESEQESDTAARHKDKWRANGENRAYNYVLTLIEAEIEKMTTMN